MTPASERHSWLWLTLSTGEGECSNRGPTRGVAGHAGRAALAVPAEAVAEALASDPAAGLTAEEVADRLRRFGPNDLVERGRKPAWRLLAEQFANTMILVLVAAGLVTAVIGDLKDTVVILAIVVLNAVVGFVQEYRAAQALLG
jgi:magnesium-transporting ATPase (P-type)